MDLVSLLKAYCCCLSCFMQATQGMSRRLRRRLQCNPPKTNLDIPDGTPLDEKPLTTVNPSTSSPNDLAIQVEQGLSTILRNITFNHTDNGPLAFPGNMLHSNPEMHLHIVLGRLQESELGIRIRARRRVPTSAPPLFWVLRSSAWKEKE